MCFTMENNNRFSFRPEIDGLRAFAVLSVIAFHLHAPYVPGGFIGVDVFFAISGYLISKHIYLHVAEGNFSFLSFYYRRLRRIYPAYITTIFFTILASYFVLGPEHLTRLAKSASSASLFLSNLFFCSEAGYFDTQELAKPLLHSWSLGVEEQFYLFWPLLVVASFYIYKRGCACKEKVGSQAFVAAVFIFICFASLLLSIFYTKINQSVAFYLVPFRIFEFGIGALVFFVEEKFKVDSKTRTVFQILSILLLSACLWMYSSDQKSFPGYIALLPAFMAAIFIWCGSTPFSRLLFSNPLALLVGKLSYSLYLVHWPIFVLYRYPGVPMITKTEAVILLLSVFPVAYILHICIEKPFRLSGKQNNALPATVFWRFAVILFFVSLGMSSLYFHKNGLPRRFPPGIIKAIDNLEERRLETWDEVLKNKSISFPLTDERNVLFLGNSHSKDIFNAISSLDLPIHLKHQEFYYECLAYLEDEEHPIKNKRGRFATCPKVFSDLFESEDWLRADVIVLGGSWKKWSIRALPKALEKLREIARKKIIVFGPKMYFLGSVPYILLHHGRLEGATEYINNYSTRGENNNNSDYLSVKKSIEGESGVYFVDVIGTFCFEGICPIFTDEQEITYYDENHWTLEGAELFGQQLIQKRPDIISALRGDQEMLHIVTQSKMNSY